ncbi:WD40 repeat domain-containing protein [Stackebrandtia nassauensis]|uniref:WD-40 repeat protein n=1 Tax=Stackebrandtia nassauensis (strain DSM 44728 / CIP 108903 / NRRL B-16338 / NBRC 102104 / LLR-40K-21) TaxID=446470 RepID=D3PWN6_STANL|nr:WD40 repeat domain-containing protein [Stackebrandtia nassauensis]ADD43258.1 WD-40 repeat protein [Stackebrandtia nassauensis DSM 44728]
MTKFDDVRAIARAFVEYADSTWACDPEPYLCRHAAEFTAEASILAELLPQQDFLKNADPHRLVPLLRQELGGPAARLAISYLLHAGYHRNTPNPDQRALRIYIDQIRAGIAHPTVDLRAEDWTPRWAIGAHFSPALFETLTGYFRKVTALACTTVNGDSVAIIGSIDGTVRACSLTTGQQYRPDPTDCPEVVTALACTTINGDPVAIIGGTAGTLRIWNLITGIEHRRSLFGIRAVRALTCTTINGDPTAILVSDDETVWRCSLTNRFRNDLVRLTISKPITALTCATVEEQPVVITGSKSGNVRLHNLNANNEWRVTLPKRNCEVRALDFTTVNGDPLIVIGDYDGSLRILNLATREQTWLNVSEATEDPNSYPRARRKEVVSATSSEEDGSSIAVTIDFKGTLRIWDLVAGTHYCPDLDRNTALWSPALCATVDGRSVIIVGSRDGKVRVWDSAIEQQTESKPISVEKVTAIACTVANSNPVAVTLNNRATVQVLDLATAERLRLDIRGHSGHLTAVACTTVDGQPIAVIGANDGTVQAWNLTTRQSHCEPLTESNDLILAVACTTIGGQPVAVIGGNDGTVCVWNLGTGQQRRMVVSEEAGQITAVACTDINGELVVVIGCANGSLWVGNLATGQQYRPDFAKGVLPIRTLACTTVNSHAVVVLSGNEDSVQCWDLTTRRHLGPNQSSRVLPVRTLACATVDNHPIAAICSNDGTVRVWDLQRHKQLTQPIRILDPVDCLAIAPDLSLVIAYNTEVMAFNPPQRWDWKEDT